MWLISVCRPLPQDPGPYYSNWSPYWNGPPGPAHGIPFPHSPQTRLNSPISSNDAHHNRAPLPEEEVALRQILSTKRNLARHIDDLIKEASDASKSLEVPYRELKLQYESAEASYVAGQQYMMELMRVRQSMQPSLNYIRSILHPIRRYPSDILSLVFIAAVESERSYDYSLESDNTTLVTRYRKRHAALDISHVCRQWRILALETPQMWSHVRLSLSRRSSAANKLALFARNAKAVPLNVVIHHLQPSYFPTYASMDSDDEDTAVPLFDSVNHLRTVEIHFSHFRALSCLPKLGMSRLEQLEELSLRSDPIILPTTPDFSLSSYLQTAQNLRKLTLTHVALTLVLHDATLILPNLTHLIIQGPLSADAGWVSLPHYLAMAPNLVKLVYFQNDNITAAAMPMIEMPSLESVTTNFLALSNSFVTTFSAGRVNAPNLRQVYLVSDGQDASVPLGNLLAANPTIRTLHMQGDFDPVAPSGAHILFRDAPPLHTLVITKASRRFIEALCATDETHSPLALPSLSCLKIECTRAWSANMTWSEFEALFKSRCEISQEGGLTSIGAQPLRHLTLVTHDVLAEKTRKAIESRMKWIRHLEGDRMLLFKWDAPSGDDEAPSTSMP